MTAPTWHLEGCPNETNTKVLIVLELPRVIGHGATRQSPVCMTRCQVPDLNRSAKPPMARMAVPEPPKVHVKAPGTGPRRSTMLHMARPTETLVAINATTASKRAIIYTIDHLKAPMTAPNPSAASAIGDHMGDLACPGRSML
ncbi:hypothetical protein B296_00004996 [Ensete ventricosum]|uniref:Uncharacterized protein n=1 Tax=Ensete ventricosum TaxID=4639 RepID=A0A426ZK34_ENSVE|nr:hypothetical protein B296_00004996 [Ensete ventricosum]